jgi:DNA-binding SARP family transcriptional activator/tetratricopeptide (TPR) repeat protein
MLWLQTFGELRLSQLGRGDVPLPEKALLLLTYMHCTGIDRLHRSQVASLMWSESDRSSARASLRKMIERIRRVQEEGWRVPLAVEANGIYLPSGTIASDVDVFVGTAEAGELKAMAGLLRQPFLQVPSPIAFSVWRKQQTERLFRRALGVLLDVWSEPSRTQYLDEIVEAGHLLLEQYPEENKIREIIIQARNGGQSAIAPAVSDPRIYPAVQSVPEAILPPRGDVPRLVLLPPTINGSALPSLATALIEDITLGLCGLRSITVVAPYTAEKIRGMPDKAAQLEKHAITYVIDTALSDGGLFVQMIFLPTDSIIWAERFPLPHDHIALRRSIANSIVNSIVAELRKTEGAVADVRSNPEVYLSYLKASHHLKGIALPEVRRARSGFKDTLKLDSSFAPAYAALARTYSMEWVLTARGDRSLLSQAEASARLAIKGNSELSSAYRELGVAKLYLGDVDESLEALDRAEALSPHFADAIYSYADTLVHASRPSEGLAKIEKAISLNPLAPDDYFWSAAGAAYFLGRFQDAISYIDRMASPDSAHRLAAASWAMLGNNRKARLHRRKAYELNPHFDLELWLSVLPVKEQWQKDFYREGLLKAGF